MTSTLLGLSVISSTILAVAVAAYTIFSVIYAALVLSDIGNITREWKNTNTQGQLTFIYGVVVIVIALMLCAGAVGEYFINTYNL
jgi:low temperature requirement protein LtrA